MIGNPKTDTNTCCNITLFLFVNIKKLLINKSISDNIKQFSYEICQKHNVIIHKMETDKDHIHYMIETKPNINLLDLVRTMTPYTTYYNRKSKLIWRSDNK